MSTTNRRSLSREFKLRVIEGLQAKSGDAFLNCYSLRRQARPALIRGHRISAAAPVRANLLPGPCAVRVRPGQSPGWSGANRPSAST